MTALRRSRPRRLVPVNASAPAPDASDLATAVAGRLATAHHGESVRTLEALAAAEANRLRRGRGAPIRVDGTDLADREHLARCRRIARRVLAGTATTPADGTVAYHREPARPGWAAGRRPVAAVGDFLFYAPETGPGG